MDQIQETAHPLSAAAAPVANNNIQPVAKMLPQMDKRLRSLEEQVCSQCLLYGTEGANIYQPQRWCNSWCARLEW